jgi:miniconductance mechanosensitive channel
MESALPSIVLTWREALGRWVVTQPLLATLLTAIVLLLFAWLASILARRFLVGPIGWLVRRTRFTWDDALYARGFFHRLAWGVPLGVVWAGLAYLRLGAGAVDLVTRLLTGGGLVVLAATLGAAIRAYGDARDAARDASDRPIEGYLQAAILAVYVVAGVFATSALIDRGPLLTLGGLGAASAVVALVFRDTILSLVAGIQLTSSDLMQVGDWIEMPKFDANGEVSAIALNTVKVRNWDRTFTVIPTHRFLEESFKNWRGMRDAGGRRFQRGLVIDVHSVRFLQPSEIEHLRHVPALRPYLDGKLRDIDDWTAQHEAAARAPVDGRRLTNVGTFRAYVAAYLRGRPDIRDDMTFLIRQLDPGPEGLPLEVYAFAAATDLDAYESVQADVFDHLLAILPDFGLRVFQKPSGRDLSLSSDETAPATKRVVAMRGGRD